MDARFCLDNVIHQYISKKKLWDKLDNAKLTKSVFTKIATILKSIYVSDNMSSVGIVKQRIDKIQRFRKQLGCMKTIPYIEQRSQEWFDVRHNLITASDFADALGVDKFGKKNDCKKFYMKKCGYDTVHFDDANVYLQWGVMFEPVATALYHTRTGIRVNEFGIIKNPRFPFLGASPDGITDLGIMLEIKCPYKRTFTDDSIIKQYFYQIQGQLDTCDMDECDFLEAKFEQYDTEACFWEDFEDEFNVYSSDFKEKGIVIKQKDKYIYSPTNSTKEQLKTWLDDMRNNNDDDDDGTCPVVFWYLEKFSLKRVDRDPMFIDKMNIQLTDVWSNVLSYREDRALYDKIIKPHKGIKEKKTTNSNTNREALFIPED
jgi:putative phage-type endonuclease